ncbi:prepilin-type cleavage/methylation domain-containing protein [Oxynema aestuarii]|uniref:Prepilin-type cleavage/methylation domain-containing protein n=1 Tax=Oxynema aestuarii AP17 TaxID=2064643 RepID=A0A6H1U2U4_9CYAN|nr:prepilin-type cleavage/methylation domain-containing protein [Oxynema aestuarii]QIZ72975.1 prepilin-type cleavage/methylation domain-containing protein [Oxynema aestuarii AP17]
MIAILAAIAIPSWFGLTNRSRLNKAQDRVYMAIREAQRQAKQNKTIYQASFRNHNNTAQWAIHPATRTPESGEWQTIDREIKIQEDGSTFYQHPATEAWRVQFNDKGHTNGRMGRVIVSLQNGGDNNRCVVVSTLLGALRKPAESC